MLKIARVDVIDVVGGGRKGGIGVELDISTINITIIFDETGRIGFDSLVVINDLAERYRGEAALGVFLHGTIEVAGIFG